MAGKLGRRLFLPSWYIKLVRPGVDLPDNEVMFHVPLKMTKLDIRNYLEKIYDIRVAKVNTRIQLGKTRTIVTKGVPQKKKRPDVKVAYITLADGTFRFPNLFSKEGHKDEKEVASTKGEHDSKESTVATPVW
ncbi:large ribosomal subunit protein uL23m-like [Corticium candelabrum]|uniref:large ribosomal subunit protein uL23m-like n=1 Tax=Corticium candelabrum TaxID=121492 RepID=UPI002E2551DD|nr:large ribosomal subunit protein uL23m-like [Corticium candelabrum]